MRISHLLLPLFVAVLTVAQENRARTFEVHIELPDRDKIGRGWTDWDEWSDCSAKCGYCGIRKRTRFCRDQVYNKFCKGPATHREYCPGIACPKGNPCCKGKLVKKDGENVCKVNFVCKSRKGRKGKKPQKTLEL
ncbi:unnamed protein product [Caenorhabditis auriculariae]|uniref:Uncharacterized protein n=1 Tax=Caenorhabditis auriculariae TaxID=2777116 RepID=A0A8S1H7B8_9PELO|nr:unnamed protein product [Caenorhabditis auriculariae]